MQIILSVYGADGTLKWETKGESICAVYESEFLPGDKIELNIGAEGIAEIQLDESLAKSRMYLPDGHFTFVVPPRVRFTLAFSITIGLSPDVATVPQAPPAMMLYVPDITVSVGFSPVDLEYL